MTFESVVHLTIEVTQNKCPMKYDKYDKFAIIDCLNSKSVV